jgi:hypothetical protein
VTIDNMDHFQQKSADTKSDGRSKLDRLSDNALRWVAVCVAVGQVAGCVVLAATNVGSEQHTWWGWLLIGVPVTWLFFLGAVALTFGVLRGIVGTLRWSLTSGSAVGISATASRWRRRHSRHIDASLNELVSVA